MLHHVLHLSEVIGLNLKGLRDCVFLFYRNLSEVIGLNLKGLRDCVCLFYRNLSEVIGLNLKGLRDCVCLYVYVYGIGCFFFWHINLSHYCVDYLPSVDIERGFVSHSGAVGAGGGCCFLCLA